MKLIIESNRPELQEQFCKFIIEQINTNLIIKITSNKDKEFQETLNLFNEYINSETFPFKSKVYGQKKLDIRTILVQGVLNLKYMKSKETYIISINPNTVIPGTFIHVLTLCELVDAGNLELKGTHLFTKTFKEVEKNITHYIDLFLVEADAF